VQVVELLTVMTGVAGLSRILLSLFKGIKRIHSRRKFRMTAKVPWP